MTCCVKFRVPKGANEVLRASLHAAALLALLFLLDRALFALTFSFYDQKQQLTSVASPNECFVVGSSHTIYAVDPRLLQRVSGMTVGMFAVNGASIVSRYYAIKDRLTRHDLPPPKVIVLETSKLLLTKGRYPDTTNLPFVAYAHKGLMTEWLDSPYFRRPDDLVWRRLIQTYSINGTLWDFANPEAWKLWLAATLGEPRYRSMLQALGRGTQPVATQSDPPSRTPGIEQTWRAAIDAGYRAMGIVDDRPDPALQRFFYETVELAKAHSVPLVLLDAPFYRFGDEHDQRFENIRELIGQARGDGVTVLEIPVPNETARYIDGDHLSPYEQTRYTRQLASYLAGQFGALSRRIPPRDPESARRGPRLDGSR